ncbi:MAG TPA: hypothetical protein VFS00_33325 [Polyangiaceae bacterium]|nr:hypothetical protein [Polyangiaceae bacterium]
MNVTQGSSGFRNGEAALGGADAVPDTVQSPNTSTAVQTVRKGEGPEVGAPGSAGKGAGITLISGAVLATIFVVVILMLYAGFGRPALGR